MDGFVVYEGTDLRDITQLLRVARPTSLSRPPAPNGVGAKRRALTARRWARRWKTWCPTRIHALLVGSESEAVVYRRIGYTSVRTTTLPSAALGAVWRKTRVGLA